MLFVDYKYFPFLASSTLQAINEMSENPQNSKRADNIHPYMKSNLQSREKTDIICPFCSM